VLGSLVTEVPAPIPTPDSARRLARRHRSYGKRLSDEHPVVASREETPR
jgi:hypothetical protein